MENISLGELKEKLIELTPIQNYKDIYLKRDDKFVIGEVNGGKLRQCLYLLLKNCYKIEKEHNSQVVCSCSIKSPQSAIASSVCNILGLNCNIITFKTEKQNINLTIAQEMGANIYGSPSGYNSVIESYAKKYFPKAFYINMGFASKEILDANVNQVRNIPDDLDYLVIPVGSAMNFISILMGLKKFNKNVGEVIGVYVGKNPLKTINKYYNKIDSINFRVVKYNKSYGTSVNIDNYYFDAIYEAKAYDWILKNLDVKNNKILFWVVGKRNMEKPTKKINFLNLQKLQKSVITLK